MLYLYRKCARCNCFQSLRFGFGPFHRCQLIRRTRLGQMPLHRIIKVIIGICLKMSTREILVFPILCKFQLMKSWPSLCIPLLPEWRLVDQILWFTTQRMPGRGGRWRNSPKKGMFHCHQYGKNVSAIFSTWLYLCHMNGKNTLESGKGEGKMGLKYVFPSDTRKYCSSVALIAPDTGQLQINELLVTA